MRVATPLVALTLAIAACHEAPTSIFSRPSGPAPSGLPVALRITESTGTPPFAGPAIVADGDSLVVSAEYDYLPCVDYTGAAGAVGTSVVVTISESARPDGMCIVGGLKAVFRATVRPAPRGSYTVVLRQRIDYTTGGPLERERARGSVTLP